MARSKRDLTTAQQLANGPVDLPFFMLTMLLLGIGLIMMFSASYATAYYDTSQSSATAYIRKQAIFAFLGVIIMYIISKINYQNYRKWSLFALVGSIFLLTILIIEPLGLGFGGDTVGAQRWLNLGFISFQPSELAKVSVIVYFAARLSNRALEKPRHFSKRTFTGNVLNFLERIGFLELVPYGVILAIIALLMLQQPHMSGTILILVGGASVMFAAGIHWGWFVGAGSIVLGGLWVVVTQFPYMSARVIIWQNPWSDPLGDGFQIIQSLYAIGSGGLTGLGLGQSRQKYLYVPEPENDFVFPIVVEELGFIGAVIIIILFMLLILRGYWLALHARDRFGALLIVGIITLFAVQVFLNISVVTNFLPTTGISLPFFSYGGTALMIQLAQMGMILAVSRQIQAQKQD